MRITYFDIAIIRELMKAPVYQKIRIVAMGVILVNILLVATTHNLDMDKRFTIACTCALIGTFGIAICGMLAERKLREEEDENGED